MYLSDYHDPLAHKDIIEELNIDCKIIKDACKACLGNKSILLLRYTRQIKGRGNVKYLYDSYSSKGKNWAKRQKKDIRAIERKLKAVRIETDNKLKRDELLEEIIADKNKQFSKGGLQKTKCMAVQSIRTRRETRLVISTLKLIMD